MSATRSASRSTRHLQHAPQPWLTARRGDLIELVGAAVVVLLILATVIVVVYEAGSDRVETDLPLLPFAGETVAQPAGPLQVAP